MNAYADIPADYDVQSLRVPPHSVEAEQSVIGGILIAPQAFDDVAEMLTADDFYRVEHQIAFRHMSRIAEKGDRIDLIVLCDSMASSGEIEQAGGHGYLIDIANNTPSAANLKAYARAVKERAVLRSLITVGQSIADSGYEPGEAAPAELIDAAQTAVLALDGQQDADAEQINATLKQTIDEIDTLYHSDATLTGVSTGFDALDRRTSGLQAADLIILAARPSMGKTTLAMNIAENVVMNGGAVLVFSMEMSKQQLMKRMVASVGRLPFDKVRTGKLENDQWPRLSAAVSRLKDKPLFIDDRAALTVAQMRSTARKLHKKCPLSLIVVDYLQLAQAKAESRVMEVSKISAGLKGIAKEIGVPVLALSQLSRSVEARADKRPMSSDLRDSGAIEQDADVIWFIYRDEVYDKESPYKGVAEIINTKQRNGETGIDMLTSRLSLCRFEDLSPEWRRPEPVAPAQKSRGFCA